MPIRIIDLVDDRATLRIRCGKVVQRSGRKLLEPLGLGRPVRIVLQLLSCDRCGAFAKVTILLPGEALDHERLRLGVSLHA